MKISALTNVPSPDGTETVVILKDGVAKRAGILSLVTAALASVSAAAIAAVTAARDTAVSTINALVTTASGWAAASAASATAADVSAAAAGAAAGVTLPNQATKASLDAAIGSYVNGNQILVLADETHFGEASIYSKTGGVAVYSRAAGISAQADHLGRPRLPGRLGEERSLGFHIRKAHDDVRSGARLYLQGLVVSDSLGLIDYPGGPAQWAAIEAGYFKDGPVLYGTNTTTYLDPAPSSGQPVSGKFTCTSNFKSDFTKAWIGCTQSFTAGQYCCYSGAADGSGRATDYIRVPLYKLPTPGVYKVQISNAQLCPAVGGAWVDPVVGQIASAHSLTGSELLVDVNGAAGMTVVELAVAYGQWHVKLTLVSGTGTAIVPAFEVHTKSAINIYRLSAGSNDLADESAAADPHMAALIANFRFDWVYVGSDDGLSSYQNFVPKLESALTNAALTYKPLVLFEGNAYDTVDAAVAARTDWLKDYCANKLARVVVDLLARIGGLAEVTREVVQGDGKHPYATNPIAYVAGWRTWAASHNLIAHSVGGEASIVDAARNRGTRRINTQSIIGSLLSMSWFDLGTCTWSKLGTSTMSRLADNSLSFATAASANDTLVAYINEAHPIFGRLNGNRTLAVAGGMSCRVMPLVASTTGVMRIIWPDTLYNGAYHGALTSYGFGLLIENLTATLIGWNGTTEVRGAFPATLVVNQGADVLIIINAPATSGSTTGTVDAWIDGTWIGQITIRINGNVTSPRIELSSGANTAIYSAKVTPPKIYNANP